MRRVVDITHASASVARRRTGGPGRMPVAAESKSNPSRLAKGGLLLFFLSARAADVQMPVDSTGTGRAATFFWSTII